MPTDNPDNSLDPKHRPEHGDPEILLVFKNAESERWVGRKADALSLMQSGAPLVANANGRRRRLQTHRWHRPAKVGWYCIYPKPSGECLE